MKKNVQRVCDRFKNTYDDLCPKEWVEDWEKQIQEKNFPGQDLFQAKHESGPHAAHH